MKGREKGYRTENKQDRNRVSSREGGKEERKRWQEIMYAICTQQSVSVNFANLFCLCCGNRNNFLVDQVFQAFQVYQEALMIQWSPVLHCYLEHQEILEHPTVLEIRKNNVSIMAYNQFLIVLVGKTIQINT